MTSTQPRFSRQDDSTSERQWWLATQWDSVPSLDVQEVVRRHPHVLVLAAHPDDETIGIGGLLSDLSDLGAHLTVLVATSGERSHDLPDAGSRVALGAIRRRESERALASLAPGAEIVHLGLPDTDVTAFEPVVSEAISARVRPGTLVLAPWVLDGHADHDAVGRAALSAVSGSATALAYYPVWMWHWATPENVDWADLVAVDVTSTGCWRKRAALDAYESQTELAGLPGSAAGRSPVLDVRLRERGDRLVETLIDPSHVLPTRTDAEQDTRHSLRREDFDVMYDGTGDPWRLSVSFYEQRRLALLAAFLERPSYDRVLEIGCADGTMTSTLTSRGAQVMAMDTSARAVSAARRTAPDATVLHATVPADLPDGPFDLVLISEVGYFLSPTDLVATLRGAVARLAPDGELVLCHWQHPTLGVPLDGALVHDQAAAVLGRPPRSSYRDGDLVIEAWRDGPTLAEREGRA